MQEARGDQLKGSIFIIAVGCRLIQSSFFISPSFRDCDGSGLGTQNCLREENVQSYQKKDRG
ncbi:hypothetical protein KSP40_PGU003313 [Platanthera guangdongensis]|uniref:Uncharacterized protein n=1 Tax=Platanthera guangdongensis TaxID=2320717 RepID=A0ABR2LTD4_9ASPA